MDIASLINDGMASRTPGRPYRKAPYITQSTLKAKDLVAYNELLAMWGMADPLADLPLI